MNDMNPISKRIFLENTSVSKSKSQGQSSMPDQMKQFIQNNTEKRWLVEMEKDDYYVQTLGSSMDVKNSQKR